MARTSTKQKVDESAQVILIKSKTLSLKKVKAIMGNGVAEYIAALKTYPKAFTVKVITENFLKILRVNHYGTTYESTHNEKWKAMKLFIKHVPKAKITVELELEHMFKNVKLERNSDNALCVWYLLHTYYLLEDATTEEKLILYDRSQKFMEENEIKISYDSSKTLKADFFYTLVKPEELSYEDLNRLLWGKVGMAFSIYDRKLRDEKANDFILFKYLLDNCWCYTLCKFLVYNTKYPRKELVPYLEKLDNGGRELMWKVFDSKDRLAFGKKLNKIEDIFYIIESIDECETSADIKELYNKHTLFNEKDSKDFLYEFYNEINKVFAQKPDLISKEDLLAWYDKEASVELLEVILKHITLKKDELKKFHSVLTKSGYPYNSFNHNLMLKQKHFDFNEMENIQVEKFIKKICIYKDKYIRFFFGSEYNKKFFTPKKFSEIIKSFHHEGSAECDLFVSLAPLSYKAKMAFAYKYNFDSNGPTWTWLAKNAPNEDSKNKAKAKAKA